MAPTNSYGQEMGSIYLIKIKITTKFFKFASISLTVPDRAISSNFQPTGYLSIVLLAIFKKFSPPQKWRPF